MLTVLLCFVLLRLCFKFPADSCDLLSHIRDGYHPLHSFPLQWRHDERLMMVYSTVYSSRRSQKTSKLRVTGLCVENSPVTGEFPAQRASNAENVPIWWRHHAWFPRHQWVHPSGYGYIARYITTKGKQVPAWAPFQYKDGFYRYGVSIIKIRRSLSL